MNHFLCKLIPPRPTFATEMTEAEAAIMREHAAYWRSWADKGVAIVFGAVLDPAGTWGVAVVEADTEQDVHALTAADPVIKSAIGAVFEVYAMPGAVVRPQGDNTRQARATL